VTFALPPITSARDAADIAAAIAEAVAAGQLTPSDETRPAESRCSLHFGPDDKARPAALGSGWGSRPDERRASVEQPAPVGTLPPTPGRGQGGGKGFRKRISTSNRRVFRLLAGKLPQSRLGLFRQHRPNAEVAFDVSASECVSLLARFRPVQPFRDYGEREAALYAARRVGSRLRYPTRVQP
jgi:hypothetical protein